MTHPPIRIKRLCVLSSISIKVLAATKCSTVGAISSKAKADNKAPAPKAASNPIITEGILNKRPTNDPRVKEQAAIAPDQKDHKTIVLIYTPPQKLMMLA
jgi:hypothetical protein